MSSQVKSSEKEEEGNFRKFPTSTLSFVFLSILEDLTWRIDLSFLRAKRMNNRGET